MGKFSLRVHFLSHYSWLFAIGDDATVAERYANPYTLCVHVRVCHTLENTFFPFRFTSHHLLLLLPPTSATPEKEFYKDAEKVNNTGISEESVNRPWAVWTR